MRNKNYILFNLLAAFFACFLYASADAQQSRVDSIVQMLDKSNTAHGIDSAMFDNTLLLIEKTTLDNSTVSLLEKAGTQFTKGNDESWNYRIRFSIMNSLITTDKNKAIDYGKKNYETLKKSKTPNAFFIRSLFFRQLRLPYRNSNMLNEGFQYFNSKLKEFKLTSDSVGLADSYYVLAGFYLTTGLIDQAIYNLKKSISYMRADTVNDRNIGPFSNPVGKRQWINNNAVLGIYYLQKGDYQQSIRYSSVSRAAFKSGYSKSMGNSPTYIAYAKILLGKTDSVEYLFNLVINDKQNQKQIDNIALANQIQALYKINTGALDEAEALINKCWQLINENNIAVSARSGTVDPDYFLALVRIKQNRINDAASLLLKDIARLKNVRLDILRDYKLLAELYGKTGNHRQAAETYKTYISLQDSLQADQAKYRSLSFETEQQMNENELSINKLQSENKISSLTRNFSIGIAILLIILAVGLYQRFRFKQKANLVLESTLSNLKSTQSQLIQSEKMASLGELTAGIAHEIQNPLNFVNNFSEVNTELIDEMKLEIKNGNLDEALSIANDIADNERKITQHGKRADAIVKGMLQHSRSSSGVKEPTNINAIADEYLRLAYHGLRAKDKTFNATLHTDFDHSIGKINAIPQDIGRVILNLITNAFYSVAEKKQMNIPGYEPTVSVSTQLFIPKSENSAFLLPGEKGPEGRMTSGEGRGEVQIKVKDNGLGIPQKVLDKIYQPFFTTKPTGQGTGLGLSMSYEIVTKAHSGELKVDTKEGEGAEFTIILPV